MYLTMISSQVQLSIVSLIMPTLLRLPEIVTANCRVERRLYNKTKNLPININYFVLVVNICPIMTGKHYPTMGGKNNPAIDSIPHSTGFC
jgi:hypothetical protein